ncbi:cytochrome P450 [Streptomyces sp. NPDC047985]|uniref:cytochrome P450 n=1 Tax=unclassified Streptomyces TaxID=2593676 RepID=UPI00341E569F
MTPRPPVPKTPAPNLPPAPGVAAARARRRDRRVYTRAHPVLFALLAATRRRPFVRLGGTVLVHGTDAYRRTLTRVPLDRTAAGTTGGTARELSTATAGKPSVDSIRRPPEGGLLFDQEGDGHREARRSVADSLGAAGVERLRPVWRAVLDRCLAPLDAGRPVDLVPIARELAGATVCALLGTGPGADPSVLAAAAGDAASAAVRDHLPGPRRPGSARAAAEAAARLETLLATSGGGFADGGLRAMLAVAAVNTTVAALPRAAAWCADAGLWDQAADDRLRPALVTELLRVTAPSPLLPRVAAAAADATAGGCPVRAGDRLVLVARHAARAHDTPPDARRPMAPAVSQLVFGAGPHACPGARLARAQLDDVLASLAPRRPVVVRARVDRRAALPGWRTLTIRALSPNTTPPAEDR